MNTVSKKKILVVDDDDDVVEKLTATLEADGFDVVSAGGQDEAENLILSVKPDVAVLDLMMEKMDSGFVLCHYLKKLHPGTHVIVLSSATAATGISFATESEEARSWIKVDKLLDKPVRPEQIRSEVRKMLGMPSTNGHHAH